MQNPNYGTMTLTQGWDPGTVLVKWMNKISDPTVTIDQKKADVTVVFMDSSGQPLFQWVGNGRDPHLPEPLCRRKPAPTAC